MSRRVPGVMVTCLTLILFIVASVAAAPPAHVWSKQFGGTSPDFGEDVATDASGNVFVAGSYQGGSADFGGHILNSGAAQQAFVAKYDKNGNYLWARNVGTSMSWPSGIATYPAGDVCVTGQFQGTTDFGGGSITGAGSVDIFVVKYSASGNYLWGHASGGPGVDEGNAIAVDNNSNTFSTGNITIGPFNFDVFVNKFDPTGSPVAGDLLGSTGYDYGRAIATDAAGNVILVGDFEGTVSFGPATFTSAGGPDIFIMKYTNNLLRQWVKQIGGTGNDISLDVVVTPAGEIYLPGSFENSVNFGGGTLTSAGSSDAFLAKYNGGGGHLWSKRFGGSGYDDCPTATVDASGYVAIGAYCDQGVDFGGGTLPGSSAMCVARFNSAGNHQWSTSFYGNVYSAAGIATDPHGDVFVTGFFGGTIDLGGGVMTSANADGFLVKFSGPMQQPEITSITDIGNDQGRKVKIRFTRSGWDGSPTLPVTQYEAYRRDDPPPSIVARDPAGLSTRELQADGWTIVGTAPAHGENTYGMDVATIGDSTLALGPYNSVFYIRAATGSSTIFFDSDEASGYSVDNLAPGIPGNFVFVAGNLTWQESNAEDFDYFTVYGSNTNSFGAASVVDHSVAPAMNVNTSPYVYYFVTATDFSGNEGKPAIVNSLSGVGGTPASYVLSVSNYPNPFNPRTTVKYTVPSRGMVDINVYDASGAHVATLFHGERNAGAYSIEWDGVANGSAVSSGVYFARITQQSQTRTHKMVLLK